MFVQCSPFPSLDSFPVDASLQEGQVQQSHTSQVGLDSAWETLLSFIKWKEQYKIVQYKDYKGLAPFPQETASSPMLPITLSCTCAHPVFPQLIQPDMEELSLHLAGFIDKLFLLSACKAQGSSLFSRWLWQPVHFTACSLQTLSQPDLSTSTVAAPPPRPMPWC